MRVKDGSITLDGHRIDEGCSIFHKDINRVLWFDDVEGRYVQFQSLSGPFSMELSEFEDSLNKGVLQIEHSG